MIGEEIVRKFAIAGSKLTCDAATTTFQYDGIVPDRLVEECDRWIEHVFAFLTGLCPVCRIPLALRTVEPREYLTCPIDQVHFADSRPIGVRKSAVPMTPRALVNARAQAETARAEDFLRSALADGRQPKKVVLRQAHLKGITTEAIARARKLLR